jgi:hypothetical protein
LVSTDPTAAITARRFQKRTAPSAIVVARLGNRQDRSALHRWQKVDLASELGERMSGCDLIRDVSRDVPLGNVTEAEGFRFPPTIDCDPAGDREAPCPKIIGAVWSDALSQGALGRLLQHVFNIGARNAHTPKIPRQSGDEAAPRDRKRAATVHVIPQLPSRSHLNHKLEETHETAICRPSSTCYRRRKCRRRRSGPPDDHSAPFCCRTALLRDSDPVAARHDGRNEGVPAGVTAK